jgi:hypothetical protein
MLIQIETRQLEPGTHISRHCIATLSVTRHEIPDDECKEARPDCGEYLPITTFSAIERALRKRGLITYMPDPFVYFFGVVKPGIPCPAIGPIPLPKYNPPRTTGSRFGNGCDLSPSDADPGL